MPAGKTTSRTISKLLFGVLLTVVAVLIVNWLTQQSKPWVVPDTYKALQNPLTSSESNLRAARQLYSEDCAQCHGPSGKGDGPEAWMHRPKPADLTDSGQIGNVTDGEMFYQITEGRRPMPAFKNRMSSDQRWQLVLLLRSFSSPASRPKD